MNQGITLKDLVAFGSIGATIIAGAFFFGGLAARVQVLEHSTVTAERIATLEAEVRTMRESTDDLKGSIKDLVRAVKAER
jgi:hypothetical protein